MYGEQSASGLQVPAPAPGFTAPGVTAPAQGWLILSPQAVERDARTAEAGDLPVLGGATKRALDLAVAATALFLFLPLIAMVAVLIRLTTRGPIFYLHERVGHSGRMFRCAKFRTMVPNGDAVLARHLAENPEAAREWALTRKLRRDPRITTIGAVLRASSIDELPQLLNVIRGEMSCVGPRPIVQEELARFGEHAAAYLTARPGLTGLWQVSGRSNCSYEERVRLDTAYVKTWSLWADLTILFRTVGAVLRTDETA